MNKFTIPLLNTIYFSGLDQFNVLQNKTVEMFNRELAFFGYTLNEDSLKLIKRVPVAKFNEFREDVIETLFDVTGAGKNYRILFKDFPYSTPSQYEAWVRSAFHYIATIFADEVTQDQLLGIAQKKYEFHQFLPLKKLDFTDNISKKVSDVIGRNSSLSVTEKKFVREYAKTNSLGQLPEKCFKETLPFLYEIGMTDYVKEQLSGATDVLRLAVFMSDPENADVSLKENTKFKMKSKDIRFYLSALDGLKNLEEDFLRHKNKWIKFAEYAHPASEANKKKYPNVAKAFDVLRNDSKSIKSSNRTIEKEFKTNTITVDGLGALIDKPGVFARRLDAALMNATGKNFIEQKDVLLNFGKIINKVPTKILFELEKYFLSRNDVKERIFFPKGQVNKAQVVTDTRNKLSQEVLEDLNSMITNEIIVRMPKLPKKKKFFVSENLSNLLLPFNKRGDSKSGSPINKGSRYKIDSNFVRLFVWWKGYIDVDLSANMYDEDWNLLDSIYFGDTVSGFGAHSGDIQSAPNGAAEFIDLDLSKAEKTGARYIATNLISFRGDKFSEFPCISGFMERDSLKSGEGFEAKSVKTKIDVNSPNTSQMMFAVDLEKREIILMDIANGSRSHYSSRSSSNKFQVVAKAAIDLVNRKPTVYDVVEKYVLKNGTFVDDKEDADIVYDIDTIDMEEILSLTK